ncbi:uncharacterized protein KIAA0040 homolog isoform X1 [Mirounga leonina]|uniref:uncharacterized protein KIAA0040 homolog isoform X1 n=1 Tax=Mirounga leonina TaxID=9715 RepID=UPI00156C3700|nr:uncharacterized protein KIAA0040 homolog isoform X1 [Mirounga leonina]
MPSTLLPKGCSLRQRWAVFTSAEFPRNCLRSRELGAGRSWSETSKMRGVGPREGRERRGCLPPGERQDFQNFSGESRDCCPETTDLEGQVSQGTPFGKRCHGGFMYSSIHIIPKESQSDSFSLCLYLSSICEL